MRKYFAFFDELWGFLFWLEKNNGKVLIVSVFSVCPVGPAIASYLKLMTSVAQGHDVQTELKVMTYRPSALGLYVMTSGQTLSIPSRPTSATKYISCCRTSFNALRMRRPCIFSVVIYRYWRSFVEFFTEWKWRKHHRMIFTEWKNFIWISKYLDFIL